MTSSDDFDHLILCGDIGGTNTTLALIGAQQGEFRLLHQARFRSGQLSGVVEPLRETLSQIETQLPGLKPDRCCLGSAGAVHDNVCSPTNIPWKVNGHEIEREFNIPTRIINDFVAISYSLPLMDVRNSDKITPLPHPGGLLPERHGSLSAAVGAGTGLGVGFAVNAAGHCHACPTEGGHTGFAAWDEETYQLKQYVDDRIDQMVEIEHVCSGKGIVNLFGFFRDIRGVAIQGLLKEIDDADDTAKPALISQHADDDSVCHDILRLFVKIYGNVAGNIATLLVPTQGMFLAGGIANKNANLFTEEDWFTHHFLANRNPVIQEMLSRVPVYIVNDYSCSLYGAANAAVSLMQ